VPTFSRAEMQQLKKEEKLKLASLKPEKEK
jgi:hypothetical protein